MLCLVSNVHTAHMTLFAAILTANTALPWSSLAETGYVFITRAMPVHFIDNKDHALSC